ncbi:MAG: cytochrome-c peroxidase, partial [Ramlibacter sp.]
SPAAQLGELIFKDGTLSASGRLSCASCHDPQRAHASPFDSPVALGGPNLDRAGLRNPPSLAYLRFNGRFQFGAGGKPVGGFFWDGRASTLHEQAAKPFLNAREMANTSAQSVVDKIAAAPYAAQFRSVFGDPILSQADAAFDRVAFALQQYQLEDPDFAPFSSKFDAVAAGTARFTPQELHGLDLFNRPDKGNCAACHPSTKPANAPGALFTDFSYDNVGVPRNTLVAANDDATFFDGGLCGSTRTDLETRTDLLARTDLCGAFKVPSLRNVAVRKHFFHNGVFTSLEQVIRFYVRRDTDPRLWYASDALGNPIPYDDTPAALRGNVNTSEGPYDRHPGQAPALDAGEINDLATFLRTLSDSFTPS